MAEGKRTAIELGWIPLAEPWEALLLPVRGFPLDAGQFAVERKVWGWLRKEWVEKPGVSSELVLQILRLGRNGSRRLREYYTGWMPDLGVAIWPDRPPPRMANKEDFADVDPAEPPTPPGEHVLRISGDGLAKQMAVELMSGFGALTEIVTPHGGDAFFEETRRSFLPTVQERAFRSFAIYVPMLQKKSIVAATSDQLAKWSCGASAYIRESVEDQGVLIVSREPLTPLLKQSGAEFRQEPEPHWLLPFLA
jgi:hypothetical protein